MNERLVIYLASIPVLGVGAQWIAWRLRMPSILVLLALGIGLRYVVNLDHLLGELAQAGETKGHGSQLSTNLLFPMVSLAVAVILFEGGLTLRLAELKKAGNSVLRLCTLGVLASWGLTTLAAWLFVGLPWALAALIGAILVVTGPTVIAPLLRHVKPSKKVGSIAKWEGIVVDPIGAILAVLVFQIISESGQPLYAVLGKTLLAGSVLGLAGGAVLVQLLKRYWIPDFLQGVAVLAMVLGVFVASNLFQSESGLVTVTVLGMYLANQKQVSLQHVAEFKEHLTVLLISCLFIVLGSRLNPMDLLELKLGGLAFVLSVIFVIRPAAVFWSTIQSDLTLPERTFLAFLAPRGIVAAAVTSVFALELSHLVAEAQQADAMNASLTALDQHAHKLEPLTFLVITCTVAFYGLCAGPIARRLGLAEAKPQGVLIAGGGPWIQSIANAIHAEGFQVLLVDTNYRHVAAARMAGMPAECASILSEHVREELDLGGIGRLLAMTPNDEVNALAIQELTHQFGRANVYQLAPWDAGTGRRESVAEHLRGRDLFGDGLHHDKLMNLMTHGYEIKTTKVSGEFTFEHFREMYGESAILLFVIDETRNLIICTAEDPTMPKTGQTIITLIDGTQEAPDTGKSTPK